MVAAPLRIAAIKAMAASVFPPIKLATQGIREQVPPHLKRDLLPPLHEIYIYAFLNASFDCSI